MPLKNKSLRQLTMSSDVRAAILHFIGNHPAERGGMLGQDADGVIRHFEMDHSGHRDAAAYSPNVKHLNMVIRDWKAQGIKFCGFVHSHPPSFRRPSHGDEIYAAEILAHFDQLECLWLPIVQTLPDTECFEILPFAAVFEDKARKNLTMARAALRIADDNSRPFATPTKPVMDMDASIARENSLDLDHGRNVGAPTAFGDLGQGTNEMDQDADKSIFDRFGFVGEKHEFPTRRLARLRQSFNLQRHADTRLIIIGAGGGASFTSNCARIGFGDIVIIDPDFLSEENVGTQQGDPDCIGMPKAEALARQIVKINPAAAVLPIVRLIEDIDDDAFLRLVREPLRDIRDLGKICFGNTGGTQIPRRTVLIVLTDSFQAQARGHRLGLNFDLPTICAQEYQEGIGGEITYTVGGVTPACHRCITSSRYDAYLKKAYQNDVTSEGAPIFAAEMINAVLGHILLGIVYHDTGHPRFGGMIRTLGDRNLLRLRMDPQFDLKFGNTFSKRLEGASQGDAFIIFDTAFLPQSPDAGQSPSRPICPDCLGLGDLRELAGTFADTRTLDLLPHRKTRSLLE